MATRSNKGLHRSSSPCCARTERSSAWSACVSLALRAWPMGRTEVRKALSCFATVVVLLFSALSGSGQAQAGKHAGPSAGIRALDPELTNYEYPFPVRYFALCGIALLASSAWTQTAPQVGAATTLQPAAPPSPRDTR